MEKVYNKYFFANKIVMSFTGMWPLQAKKYAYPLRTLGALLFIFQFIPMVCILLIN